MSAILLSAAVVAVAPVWAQSSAGSQPDSVDEWFAVHGIPDQNLWANKPLLFDLRYKSDATESAQHATDLTDTQMLALKAIAENVTLKYMHLGIERFHVIRKPDITFEEQMRALHRMHYSERLAGIIKDAERQAKEIMSLDQYRDLVAWANDYYEHLKQVGKERMLDPLPAVPGGFEPSPPMTLQEEDQEAGNVVAEYGPQIMKIPGVWGIGDYAEPNGHIVIRVDVEKITPEIKREVPKTLGTFPVFIFAGSPPVAGAEYEPRSSGAGNATKPGPAAPQ